MRMGLISDIHENAMKGIIQAALESGMPHAQQWMDGSWDKFVVQKERGDSPDRAVPS